VSPSKYKDYAEDINDSGNHLLSLINQILDMSKIEAGEYTIISKDFRPREIIDEVMSMMKGRASEKGLVLNTELSTGTLMVNADQMITKQILINLLTNAIKFTPKGKSVTLRTSFNGKVVIVDVIDTGIGMSPDELKRALEPFVQIEREKGRTHEGTGLGLSLCNHFSALQGSEFMLTSEQGKGTTASLTLHPSDGEVQMASGSRYEGPSMVPSWLPSMSIGIVKWDSDHIELLNLITRLKLIVSQDEPRKVERDLPEKLAHYVDIHLASEEYVMVQMNYPDYAEHKAKHDEFRNWMKSLLSDPFKLSDDWHSTVLADSLLEWWYDHIMKEDMAYYSFFNSRRNKVDDLLKNYKGVGSGHSS
jgi:hemerythrin-like metal-binding protein